MIQFFKDIYNRYQVWVIVAIILISICFFSWLTFPVYAEDYLLSLQVEEYALAGSGTQEDPYIISTTEDLYEFAENVFLYSTIDGVVAYTELASDIDLNGADWSPIGGEHYSYGGVFNGNSHTISNCNIIATDCENVGFFRQTWDADTEIKNLKLDGITIVSQDDHLTVGGLVGKSSADIINCTVSAEIKLYGEVYSAGGIVGIMSGSNMVGCTSYGSMSTTITEAMSSSTSILYEYPRFGGMIGTVQESYTSCSDLTNYSAVNISLQSATEDIDKFRYVYIGGIIGQTWGYSHLNLVNNANISGVGAVGGIIGDYWSNGGVIANCANNGDLYSISGDSLIVGGIVAVCYQGLDNKIINCINSGNITGTSIEYSGVVNTGWGGGIMGTGTTTMEQCVSTGNISFTGASTHYVGGLVGGNNGVIRNSYCTGDITVESATSMIVGGLVGIMQNNLDIVLEMCYYTGVVVSRLSGDTSDSATSIGGIVGYNMRSSGTTIQNNYYNAEIIANSDIDSSYKAPDDWYGYDSNESHYTGDLIANNAGVDTQTLQCGELEGFIAYDANSPSTSGVWIFSEEGYPILYWQA